MKTQKMNFPAKGKRKSIFKSIAITFSLFIALSIGSLSMAQDLDDFKKCAALVGQKGKGPETIPYESLRRETRKIENFKKEAAKEAKTKFGVEVLTDIFEKAKKDLKEAKKDLKEAEEALEEQRGYLPNHIDDEKKAVKKAQKKVDDLQKDVNNAYTEIDYGMNHWKQLAIERGKVRVCFEKAIKRLEKSEKEPEKHIGKKPTDAGELKKWKADLVNLNKYITKIKKGIKSKESGHEIAEKQAFSSAKNLRNLRK